MILRYLLMLVVLAVLPGCESLNIKNQADKLRTSLDHYGAALRWDRINEVYAFHVTRDGKQPEVDLEKVENYSVSSFKPIDPVLNAEATEAVVAVEIDYYDEQYGTLRKLKETQHWWFNAEKKLWFTDSAFPAFK